MIMDNITKEMNRKFKRDRKQINKIRYEEKRAKAIKRIRSSWASPIRNKKNLSEADIRSYM